MKEQYAIFVFSITYILPVIKKGEISFAFHNSKRFILKKKTQLQP
jgi:hypothetical protein